MPHAQYNWIIRHVNNNFYNREPGAVTAMLSELSWETLEQRRAGTALGE
jgi:hypothetical protein